MEEPKVPRFLEFSTSVDNALAKIISFIMKISLIGSKKCNSIVDAVTIKANLRTERLLSTLAKVSIGSASLGLPRVAERPKEAITVA